MSLSRREVIRRVVRILPAFSLLPFAGASARAAESCGDPTSESLRSSLHYADSAQNPTQSCSACTFFTAGDAAQSCGKCVIMSGPVNPKGHCDSWTARS